jgi:DNA-binding transcriptional ArsR family regulator
MGQASSYPTDAPSSDPLGAVFLALSDPTRRAMLKALAEGDRTLTELARPFSISIPAVTKHLRVLERAGLISRSRQAQRKPCSLRVEPLKDAAEWIDHYRAEWEARLDRLDAFVVALQKEEDALDESAPSGPSKPSASTTEPDGG